MRAIFANRTVRWRAGGVAGAVALLLLALAAFPWGLLKGRIEAELSRRTGRPVTIAAMERTDGFGFHPRLRLSGIHVPQAAWAGGGDLARIDRASVGFDALPLLIGRFRPRDLVVERATLVLVRAKDGRENWTREQARHDGGGGGGGTWLSSLIVRDTTVIYRDLKQNRAFRATLGSDAVKGFHLAGAGQVRDAPVTIEFAGPPITGDRAGRWPFTARIDGPALAMTAKGTMAHPLQTGDMALDATARASDLKMIDAIVEAGLFETQAVGLTAHVEHRDGRWIMPSMDGTIGQSRFTGHLVVAREDGRTRLDGAIDAATLDFDDLSSREGLAETAAKQHATGPRLVPDTQVNLARVGRTDGRIAVRARRIVSRSGDSPLKSLSGVLTLDHQTLTVSDLRMALSQGAIVGRAVIAQGGAAEPRVTLDLRLVDSTIPALGGGGGTVTGRVDARAWLVGRGGTLRAAVGRASGRIGLAARDGALPARIASELGFDAGRALTTGGDERAGLRCAIIGVAMRDGRGTFAPLILDTSQSQMRGTGTVIFPDERLDITLTGAPKRDSVLRLPGSARMEGTIEQPSIIVPREVKSIGNIFKAIGRAITGHQGPVATDADCAALSARVLR